MIPYIFITVILKHLYISKGIEDDIVKDIENRFEEIQNNYKNYLITNRKYIRILEEYNKLFKYTLMTPEYNKINEEKK